MPYLRFLKTAAVVAAMSALIGCGGGGGEPPAPNLPVPPEIPDVGVNGAVTKGPSCITAMSLNIVDPQDSLDVAADASAEVKHGSGGPSVHIPLSVIGRGKGLRLGQIPLRPGMNIIELKARSGYVIGFVDGRTHTVLFIGRVQVGIEMLEDGTIIAPTSFEVKVPTRDVEECEPPAPPSGTPERQAIFRGLAPGDNVRGRVRDRFGGQSVRDCQANAKGVATINDYHGGITTHNLSGPNSLVGFYFAQNAELLP